MNESTRSKNIVTLYVSNYEGQTGKGVCFFDGKKTCIMQHIAGLSNNRMNLAAGTVHGALNTLLKKGWIIQFAGEEKSRKKAYEITAEGREVLRNEILRLQEMVANGEEILGCVD